MATELETRVEKRAERAHTPALAGTGRVAWFNEPAAVLLGYALLVLVARIAPGSLWQAGLAALLALFGPGLALTAVLYPRFGELDAIERMALSAMLSLAVGGITGFILIHTAMGLTLTSFMASVALFNVLCYVGVVYRRRNSALAGLEAPRWVDRAAFGRWFQGQNWGGLLLAALLVALLAGGGGALVQASRLPVTDPPMTEFFLLDQNGQVENFPTTVAAGGTVSLNYGIINREVDAGQYQVLALLGDRLIGNSGSVSLSPGQQQVGRLDVVMPDQVSGSVHIDIVMFRDGKRYRNLSLWMNVNKP